MLEAIASRQGHRARHDPCRVDQACAVCGPDVFLSHYNKCLRTGSIPDAWLLSEVVMLVKDARKDTRRSITTALSH